jgi:hypothetical protein
VSNQLLVSTRKGLFHFVRDEAASTWKLQRVSFLGDNVTNSHVDRHTGDWFAALNLGHFGVKLRRSSDAGKTWSECGVPEYPEGEMVPRGDGKPEIPAKLELIWVLESSPGMLWAGTAPGGLYRSTDRGDSWQLMRSLWNLPNRKKWFGGGYDYPAIHSIAIDPRDVRKMHVAISCGGVWHTDDAGETWSARTSGMLAGYMPPGMQDDPDAQDPHCLVQCPANPERLWVQHHSGIFGSTDGGRSWTAPADVIPSAFGFAVAVHPHDGDTAWFVPAVKDECRVPVEGQLVVTRTRDGGKTFETLREGLPQEQAYDLVYRHGLTIDSTGTRLAFGSTTGGLWTSDDSGDSWQQLPTRLPPIHAVHFI